MNLERRHNEVTDIVHIGKKADTIGYKILGTGKVQVFHGGGGRGGIDYPNDTMRDERGLQE